MYDQPRIIHTTEYLLYSRVERITYNEQWTMDNSIGFKCEALIVHCTLSIVHIVHRP